MARFRKDRFNPWTNLNKMLNQKKVKSKEEDVQEIKSEVGIFIFFLYILLLVKNIQFILYKYVKT